MVASSFSDLLCALKMSLFSLVTTQCQWQHGYTDPVKVSGLEVKNNYHLIKTWNNLPFWMIFNEGKNEILWWWLIRLQSFCVTVTRVRLDVGIVHFHEGQSSLFFSWLNSIKRLRKHVFVCVCVLDVAFYPRKKAQSTTQKGKGILYKDGSLYSSEIPDPSAYVRRFRML